MNTCGSLVVIQFVSVTIREPVHNDLRVVTRTSWRSSRSRQPPRGGVTEESQRQVPVKQRHPRLDPRREQLIHEPIIKLEPTLIDPSHPIRQHAAPRDREPIRLEPHLPHQPDIFLVPMHVIRRDRPRVPAEHGPRLRAELVIDVPPALLQGMMPLRSGTNSSRPPKRLKPFGNAMSMLHRARLPRDQTPPAGSGGRPWNGRACTLRGELVQRIWRWKVRSSLVRHRLHRAPRLRGRIRNFHNASVLDYRAAMRSPHELRVAKRGIGSGEKPRSVRFASSRSHAGSPGMS